MKVKDIMAKFIDNYGEIRIETCRGFGEGMEILYTLKKHGCGLQDIPDRVSEMEVDMMALFLDGLSIMVIEGRTK